MAEIIMDVWAANREIERLKERNAALETGIKAISAQCRHRQYLLCDVNCPGRIWCDTEGLGSLWFDRNGTDNPQPCPLGAAHGMQWGEGTAAEYQGQNLECDVEDGIHIAPFFAGAVMAVRGGEGTPAGIAEDEADARFRIGCELIEDLRRDQEVEEMGETPTERFRTDCGETDEVSGPTCKVCGKTDETTEYPEGQA